MLVNSRAIVVIQISNLILTFIAMPCSGQDVTADFNKILELHIADDASVDNKNIVECCSKILSNEDHYGRDIVCEALTRRGRSYCKLGKYDSAIKDFNRYCSLRSESADVLCARAGARAALMQWDYAERDVTKAFRLDPKHVGARLGLATILWRHGSEKSALELVDKAISLNPKDGRGYFLRGQFYHDVDPSECVSSMNKFLELCPNDSEYLELPYYFRGVSLRLLNRTEEALSNQLKARKLNPESAEVARELGFTYGILGKFHLACHYGEVCIKLNPSDPEGYYLRARYCYEIGKVKESLLAAEKYVVLRQDNSRYYRDIAKLYFILGKYDSSVEFYDKALARDQNSFYALIGKASLLSTCPDPKFRNGKISIGLAIRALGSNDVRSFQRWSGELALADAYAEVGDFPNALKYARRAIELAGADLGNRKELLERVSLFENARPYRMYSKAK